MHAVVVVLLRPKQSLFSLGLFFLLSTAHFRSGLRALFAFLFVAWMFFFLLFFSSLWWVCVS